MLYRVRGGGCDWRWTLLPASGSLKGDIQTMPLSAVSILARRQGLGAGSTDL